VDAAFGPRLSRHRKIRAQHRSTRAFIHWDIRSDDIEDAQRILGAHLHRDVAVHRGCRHELEVWVQRRKQEGNRVIGSCIDIKDELRWH
jgi:hypothetical protein